MAAWTCSGINSDTQGSYSGHLDLHTSFLPVLQAFTGGRHIFDNVKS